MTAVPDRGEGLRIELGEKRIAISQVRIMLTKACLKNLAALADRVEPAARGLAVAIIAPQIAKRLFAFKDCCRYNLFSLPSTRGQISTVATLRQTHIHRARGKPLCLSPYERESFELRTHLRYTFGAYYSGTYSSR